MLQASDSTSNKSYKSSEFESMDTWEIDSIKSVPKFLAAVIEHLPTARTVSFEIQSACSAARKVYSMNHSPVKLRPLRDTISPKTGLHYCAITPSLVDDLARVLLSKPVKEVFWHVKGYDDRKLLFFIHDADMADSACLSGQIDGKIVRAIAAQIGRTAAKIQIGHNWDEDERVRV
jgi:hypothetical protein